MIRREWSGYLAFHSKHRSLLRLNKSAYVLLRALIGKSMEEAVNIIAKTHVMNVHVREDVAKSALNLVEKGVLKAIPDRPSINQRELNAVIVSGHPMHDEDQGYYEAPESVLWSLTNRCNIRCKYCAPNAGEGIHPDLPLTKLIHIQEQLSNSRVFEVIITGGEALLRKKDTFSLLERLSARNHFVHLLSNGILVDDEVADKLLELNIGIGVSLDGPDDETNTTSRTFGSYFKVRRALTLLAKKGVWTNVLTVLTKYNYPVLNRLFELLDEIGIKYFILQPLRPCGRGHRIFDEMRPSEKQLQELPNVIERLKHRFPEINVDDYEVSIWGDMLREKELPKREERHIFSCGAAVRFCVVDEKGEIAPCNALLDVSCGNLIERNLPDIWHNSSKLKDLRVLASKSVGIVSDCLACRFNVVCDGGCRADAFHTTGSWLGLHPFCLSHLSSHGVEPGLVNEPQSCVKSEGRKRHLGPLLSH